MISLLYSIRGMLATLASLSFFEFSYNSVSERWASEHHPDTGHPRIHIPNLREIRPNLQIFY